MRKWTWWLSGGIAALFLLAGILAITILPRHHKQPLAAPATLVTARQSAGFPLYYASSTAAAFQLNQDSVSATNQAVIYSYQYDHNKTLAVSVQPIGNLNVDQFNPTSDFTTTVGHAYIVDIESRTTAAVVGNKSWALINAPDKISVSELTQFINSLRVVD